MQNKRYIETSGLGVTDRMMAVMKPKQAKRDEDVLIELERWEDELNDLRALGASELAYDHKLTAMREIVTLARKITSAAVMVVTTRQR